MRVTLADVAELAGVTPQTVSHVLSGTRGVRITQETRDRIIAAANELGYKPNRLARAMKTGKTKIISAWIPINRPNLSSLKFIQELHEVITKDQYDLIVSGVKSELAYAAHGDLPNIFPVDGIIAFDAQKAFKAFRGQKTNDQIPGLVLGYELFNNADTLAWDLHGASVKVMRLMLKTGSTRIVHLLPEWVESGFPNERRRRAYTETMLGQHLRPELVSATGESVAEGYRAMATYLSEGHHRPDGVFAFNDALALGAVKALESIGLRVPTDCQVWGMGDFEEAREADKPVSTMRIPFREVASCAWKLLKDRIDGKRNDSELITLPMEIIPRATSRDT
ncbi:LacI family DNA-binding transcriptional regulator [Kamptonema cortianum]|nr:LacI family DNA-binding transcriptional regulator [Geitlerinema splendidum]MDK3158385.1 LacI family DNA-binding transcriptional regulator [Kamptonema cortianum]